MAGHDNIASAGKRQRRIHTEKGKMWLAALICASILASQETLSANAFNIAFNPFHGGATANRAAKRSAHLFNSGASTVEERRSKLTKKWSQTTMQMPSQMFLKRGQVSVQPMSSLASDFFDTTGSTGNSRIGEGKDEIPIYIPQRKQGILGFVLSDDRDHHQVFTSSKQPLRMEDSSTSLHSSTDNRRSSFQLDFEAWNLTDQFNHEDWFAPRDDNSNNPILNRSPNSASSEATTKRTTAPAWFPWMPSITQIKALKVSELRQICSDRGLEQSGTKVELQQRLWDWTRTQQYRQRRMMIGGEGSGNGAGRLFRLERKASDNSSPKDDEDPSSTTSNSLGEWLRKHEMALLQQRKKIHKKRREGQTATNKQRNGGSRAGRPTAEAPTEEVAEYLSKLFDASSSQYSNLEVKQMYKAAKAADQNGDRTLCKQILLKLKAATPHDARIHRRLARMYSEEGKVDDARNILREGLRQQPTNAFLWHGLGQLETKAGYDDEGRRCYMKAIQSDPSFPNAYHALGTMEHSRGQIANAMKILKVGVQNCPTNHRLHHALGDLYRGANMLDMAEKSFRRALEHTPDVSKGFTYTSLAHVAHELGKIKTCRSFLRKAVASNDGRQAKGWLALARLEESEGDIDAARAVCITALNQYEKTLLQRNKKGLSEEAQSVAAKNRKLSVNLRADPIKLKNAMLASVPKYRSGDHFLKVYRNWARLEETYGQVEAVDDVYKRAMIAFPLEWKLPVAWGNYHFLKGHDDKARLLYNEAANRAGNGHARPHRIFAEFEMKHGRYADARKILFDAARSVTDTADGGLGNQGEMAQLFKTWAVCEWYLGNLSRAEVLFDHALRLTGSGADESALRSFILYAIAMLEFDRGELHLAQHCIGLCLKENTIPGGNSKVWSLWAKVAEDMGDRVLFEQCAKQIRVGEEKADNTRTMSASVLGKLDVERQMRKDPWHYKIFDLDKAESTIGFVDSIALPGCEDSAEADMLL